MVRQRALLSCFVASLLSPFAAGVACPANRDRPYGCGNSGSLPHNINWELQGQPLISLTNSSAGDSSFEVNCKKCQTWGTVRPSFKNQDSRNPLVEVEFNGVGAYFDFSLKSSTLATQAIQLLPTQPIYRSQNKGHGAKFWVYVDLIFRVTDAIDFEGGFHLSIADQSSLTIDLNDEQIQDVDFKKGTMHQSIPIMVNSGSAVFTADLRVRVHSEIWKHKDDGAGKSRTVAGAYINLVEFTSDLSGDSDTCPPSEEWYINAGAYAAESQGESQVVVPTESTIFYSGTYAPDCAVPKTTSVAEQKMTTTSEASHAWTTTPDSSTATTSTEDATTTPSLQKTTVTSEARGKTTEATTSAPVARRAIPVQPDYLNTTTTVVTSCRAHIINCPTQYTTKITVTATTSSESSSVPHATSDSPSTLWKRHDEKQTPTMTDGQEFTSLGTPIVSTFAPPAETTSVLADETTTLTTTTSSTVTITSVSTATMTISSTSSVMGEWGASDTNPSSSTSPPLSSTTAASSSSKSSVPAEMATTWSASDVKPSSSTSPPLSSTTVTSSSSESSVPGETLTAGSASDVKPSSSTSPPLPSTTNTSSSSVGTNGWHPTSTKPHGSGGLGCSKSAPSQSQATGSREQTTTSTYVMPRQPSQIITLPNIGPKLDVAGRSGLAFVLFLLALLVLF